MGIPFFIYAFFYLRPLSERTYSVKQGLDVH